MVIGVETVMRHWDLNYLLKLQEKLKENEISPAEFVTDFLLQKPLEFQKKKLFADYPTSSKLMQSLNENHWKGYNDRIRRSLLEWHRGHYPLVLLHRIPTPHELLLYQGQGQRVVTVFINPTELDQNHHGKNAWDFTIHDLVHADHFFEKPEWRKGQIEFYQFLERNWEHPEISKLHNLPEFEYLIADMNSHPRHLFLTLRALILKSLKNQFGLPPEESLSDSHEQHFQEIVEELRSQLQHLEVQ